MSSVNRSSARQSTVTAYVDVVLANLTTTVDVPVLEMPTGSVLVSGDIVPTEVFNSTSSDVLDVGDSGSENRYVNDASLQALTRVALVPTGYVNTAPTLVTVRWVSGGGTPTTGKFTLRVEYYVRGRSDLGPQGSDFGARLV